MEMCNVETVCLHALNVHGGGAPEGKNGPTASTSRIGLSAQWVLTLHSAFRGIQARKSLLNEQQSQSEYPPNDLAQHAAVGS
jgi:hypothetical protein